MSFDNIDTSFVLGYGSVAKISVASLGTATSKTYGTSYLSLTSGSVQRRSEVGFVTSYDIPFTNQERSQIRLNSGIYTFSGNISFELTNGLVDDLIEDDFLNGRKMMFNLTVFDGEYTVNIPQCVWQNFSITGNPNGAIQCSISFLSLNAYEEQISVSGSRDITAVSPDILQPYWQYGSSSGNDQVVQSFTLTFSRNVSPVFLNNNLTTPSYLRVGMLQVQLNISCLQEWFDLSTIVLGSKKLSFNNSFFDNQNWQFSGMSGEGIKSFTMKGSNEANNSVFTLS